MSMQKGIQLRIYYKATINKYSINLDMYISLKLNKYHTIFNNYYLQHLQPKQSIKAKTQSKSPERIKMFSRIHQNRNDTEMTLAEGSHRLIPLSRRPLYFICYFQFRELWSRIYARVMIATHLELYSLNFGVISFVLKQIGSEYHPFKTWHTMPSLADLSPKSAICCTKDNF